MMMQLFRSIALVCLVMAVWARASIASEELPAIYTDERLWKTDEEFARQFGEKYRLVNVPLGSLVRPDLIGSEAMPAPRNEAGEPISAEVMLIYVVDTKGRVVDTTVLKSSNEQASRVAVESIRKRRFVPARFKGDVVWTADFEIVRFSASQAKGYFPGQVYGYPLDQNYAKLCSPEIRQAYVDRLKEVCRKKFEKTDTAEGLYVVVVVLPKQGARVWFLSSRRSLEDPELLDLRRQLEEVPAPQVNGGPLAFAIQGGIAGGGGPEITAIDRGYSLPIPKEWARFDGKDRRFSDAYFLKLWYLEDR